MEKVQPIGIFLLRKSGGQAGQAGRAGARWEPGGKQAGNRREPGGPGGGITGCVSLVTRAKLRGAQCIHWIYWT
jgi:hypothetical protein